MTMLSDAAAKEILRRINACPECREEGSHWIAGDFTGGGFWTCAKFYGADGRRKPEHIDQAACGGLGSFVTMMHDFGLMTPNV